MRETHIGIFLCQILLLADYKNTYPNQLPLLFVSAEIPSELKCMAHQLRVMRRIGAPRVEIDGLEDEKGDHAGRNKDGKIDKEDEKLAEVTPPLR